MNHPSTWRWLKPAEVSALVRARLKREFPATKFSVRLSSGSVRVEWTDGPTQQRIREILGEYDSRHFDGSIDMEVSQTHWLYRNAAGELDVSDASCSGTTGSRGYIQPFSYPAPTPDAERVMLGGGYHNESRTLSQGFQERLAAAIAQDYGVTPPTITQESKSFGKHSWVQTKIEPEISAELRERCGESHWSTMIHRYAEDRTRWLNRPEREAEASEPAEEHRLTLVS